MTDLPEGPNLDDLFAHDSKCATVRWPESDAPCDCTRDARLRSALSDLIEQRDRAFVNLEVANRELDKRSQRVRQLEQDVQEARGCAERLQHAYHTPAEAPPLPWEKP